MSGNKQIHQVKFSFALQQLQNCDTGFTFDFRPKKMAGSNLPKLHNIGAIFVTQLKGSEGVQ